MEFERALRLMKNGCSVRFGRSGAVYSLTRGDDGSFAFATRYPQMPNAMALIRKAIPVEEVMSNAWELYPAPNRAPAPRRKPLRDVTVGELVSGRAAVCLGDDCGNEPCPFLTKDDGCLVDELREATAGSALDDPIEVSDRPFPER